jgi:hypothetical protein
MGFSGIRINFSNIGLHINNIQKQVTFTLDKTLKAINRIHELSVSFYFSIIF